jgi:hypothetical protein
MEGDPTPWLALREGRLVAQEAPARMPVIRNVIFDWSGRWMTRRR